MAQLARGKFYRAKNRDELQSIYNEIDRLEKTEVKLRRYTITTGSHPSRMGCTCHWFCGALPSVWAEVGS